METILNTALDEICAHGESGLTLSKLWKKLQPSIATQGFTHLCPNVKKVILSNLLNHIPGLKFESHGVVYDSKDNCLLSLEQSEQLDLNIVAPEHLRNGFVGIYEKDASVAKLSPVESDVLNRLAVARGNGITQNDLSKAIKMSGKDMFYALKKLERRGLIVRKSTVVRTKYLAGEVDSQKGPVATNMVYLSRYARNLGSQQRLEITKEDNSLVDENNVCVAEESVELDVHVKDFLPDLEAICNVLEKAEGKVLAVSDIKLELGYRMTPGHRAWRNIVNKLKEAQVVEEKLVDVDGKKVKRLHLLKGFSPKHFEPKSHVRERDDLHNETATEKTNRGHISELLLELPIEHQIYEMIDAEGGKGLTITEINERLGISNKQHYNRIFDFRSRFGLHMRNEQINKTRGYRLWTPGNHGIPQLVDPLEISGCTQPDTDSNFQEYSDLAIQYVDASVPEDNDVSNTPNENTGNELKVPDSLGLNGEEESEAVSSTVSEAELQIISAASLNSTLEATQPLAVPTPPRRRSDPRYPRLTVDEATAQREQWILKLLQEEKFLIRPELHRRLESFETEKKTITDRKTIDRLLNKLSQGGHCKLIVVYVPGQTNCSRTRKVPVVLHPSVSSISTEQIHEKFRSFEILIRTQSSRKEELIPLLNELPRTTHKSLKLDNQAERAEALRANGFVLAKMVRTKLLYFHLWQYVNNNSDSLLSCDDDVVLSTFKHSHDQKNPHSTCKLVDLNAAVKAMPLELFLQVVGSTQKFEDMIEKCRNGFCLSDLPLLEYKSLMDIRATGQLSRLIDILRRLKLIRLVCGGHPEKTEKLPHTTLAHALELKPYVEEPVCKVASSRFFHCPDLRPQIRHDFVLSSIKAVEEYWSTLEYCYSACDRIAALHAFPGCAVNEVFLFRSWTSVRVMKADQRAELLKRVINDGPHRKLSFKECRKIAKDLNLTLEQVLRVYYDKRQRRLTRFEGALDAENGNKQPHEGTPTLSPHEGTPTLSPKKRKRSVKRTSIKQAEAHTEFGQPHQILSKVVIEEQSAFPSTSQNHACILEGYNVENDVAATEESELPDCDGAGRDFLAKCTLSRLKPTRKGRFSWTDDADRQLVTEYARHRAALGTKFNRVDWGKLPNLPAPPDASRRRMALLRSSPQLRKSLMRLCNVLGQRYVDYLEKSRDKTSNLEDCQQQANRYDCFKHTSDVEPWDNFDDDDIRMAIDDAMRYKKMAKLETPKETQSSFDGSDERNVSCGPQSVLPISGNQYVDNSAGKTKGWGTPLSSNRIPHKYVKCTSGGIAISKRLYESLAVANAAELFKLIFLCSSKSPLVPTLLAETLRRYSEHDLFAAFNYLRDKKILIGGSSNSPFVLSQTFLRCIYFSPFPINTGNRAAKFANSLYEREKELTAEGVDLPTDLQCGDIFHLCGLLSSGEVSIAACLPDEGVGEFEDSRISKRKCDDNELSDSERYKKLKTSTVNDGETCSRRAKGFPGIRLHLRLVALSRVNTMYLLKGSDKYAPMLSAEEHQADTSAGIANLGSPTESPWQAMTTYAEHVCSFGSCPEHNPLVNPEMFRSVYSAIQVAGDQGLSMRDISRILRMQEERLLEAVVEVLETFGRVLKVNAYDTVRVVDSLYRSKYSLTPVVNIHEDATTLPPRGDSKAKIDGESSTTNRRDHKVTILNLPEEVADEPSIEKETVDKHTEARSSRTRNRSEEARGLRSSEFSCRPILPWLNGDGTTNEHVHKGLVRRVLGIVMQNPGMQEDDILSQMHVLNPQSCRTLLNMMVLDNDIFVRKIPQTKPAGAPALLGSLLGSHFQKSQLILRDHFFANPSSAHLL